MVGLDRASQERVVSLQHGRKTLTELLDESRRPFDIGEEECDGTGRKLGHARDGTRAPAPGLDGA